MKKKFNLNDDRILLSKLLRKLILFAFLMIFTGNLFAKINTSSIGSEIVQQQVAVNGRVVDVNGEPLDRKSTRLNSSH